MTFDCLINEPNKTSFPITWRRISNTGDEFGDNETSEFGDNGTRRYGCRQAKLYGEVAVK